MVETKPIFSFLKVKLSSRMKTKKAMSSNITSLLTLQNLCNKYLLCYRCVSRKSNAFCNNQ